MGSPRGTHKGKKKAGSITSDASRDEKIRGVRESIRVTEYLIHYYELLLDDAPENHLSFQAYLWNIDVRAEIIKAERRRLIASFDKASNGTIPNLQRSQRELEEKLKTLKARTPARARVAARKKDRLASKAKTLREKLTALEQELRSDGWTPSVIESIENDDL